MMSEPVRSLLTKKMAPPPSLAELCSIFVPHTGNRDANVRAAMQGFASALEEQVRKHPHLWYQFYPYWQDSETAEEQEEAVSKSG